MPYEVRKVADEWCVFKEMSDESMGCHDSEDGANEQVAAIHASEEAKRGTTLLTPRGWWAELDKEFQFTLDAAAAKGNALCADYFDYGRSAFDNEWAGRVWCSPPWADEGLGDWVGRAVAQAKAGVAEVVVMLLPVRPTSAWWQKYWPKAREIRKLGRKLDFVRAYDNGKQHPLLVEDHCLWVIEGKVAARARKNSLEDRISVVEHAFHEAYPPTEASIPAPAEMPPYMVETFEDYAVVYLDEKYYKVPYTIDEKYKAVLAPRSEWTKVESVVEQEWIEAVKRMQALKFDVDAPCRKKMLKLAVKADGTLGVGAYATVWGELDCDGERMTREAVEPYLNKGRPLMLWLHGVDKGMGSTPVGEWTKLTPDDFGLFAEGVVTEPRAVAKLQNSGAYGLSVGTLWYLVGREKAGGDGVVDITNWPLLEISIMEGGKQCVPSAHRELADKALLSALGTAAAKMGLRGGGAPNQSGVQDRARRRLGTDYL